MRATFQCLKACRQTARYVCLVMGFIMALIAPGLVAIAQGAVAMVIRETPVRADRFDDAAVLRTAPAGTSVQIIAQDAGWTQVRFERTTGWVRANALRGQGAEGSALAARETGRAFANNIVMVAGIRSVPRESRHALVLSTNANVSENTLNGVRLMGTLPQNIVTLAGAQATAAGLRQSMQALSAKLKQGDRLVVVLQAPTVGTMSADDQHCELGWQLNDQQRFSAPQLQQALMPLVSRLDKLALIAHTMGEPMGCENPHALRSASLLGTAPFALSSDHRVQVLLPDGSDLAWWLCLSGQALDSDGSGALSAQEIARCVNPNASVQGNAALVLAPGVASSLVEVTGLSPSATGEALLRDLVGQASPARPLQLRIASRLKIGRDPFMLEITSPVAGYVYLVLMGSDGSSLYMLFPNTLDTNNRIQANTPLRLPRPDWQVQAGGPAGVNHMLVIVSDQPRDLAIVQSTISTNTGPFTRLPNSRAIRQALQTWIDAPAEQGSDLYGASLVKIEEHH
jgi:uncharacterized protein YraI